jgi:hypothetical protein
VSENALILYWSHPSDTLRSLASSLASGLVTNGIKVTTIDVTKRRHLSKLIATRRDSFSHIYSLGSIPLQLKIESLALYEYFAAKFYFWVLDPIIYDLARVPETWDYFRQARDSDRLFFLFPDLTYQEVVQGIVGNKCIYFPFAGEFHGSGVIPINRNEELPKSSSIILLANVGQELSEFASQSCQEIIGQLDPFGLDSRHKASLAEYVQHKETYSNVTLAVREFMNLESRELFKKPVIRFLSAIDASEKRRRRLLVVDSVKSMKIDIFGSGWQQRFGDCPNYTFYTMNVRHDFLSNIFKRYKVLLDFSPNWDHGFNDRVVTSLGAGCRVVTTRNLAASELGAAEGLVSFYSAHHPAPQPEIEAALNAAPIEAELVSLIRKDQDWATRINYLLNNESLLT